MKKLKIKRRNLIKSQNKNWDIAYINDELSSEERNQYELDQDIANDCIGPNDFGDS